MTTLVNCPSPAAAPVLDSTRSNKTMTRVTSLYIDNSSPSSLPQLYADGRWVGYLHGESESQAIALRNILMSKQGQPLDIQIEGKHANNTFYIDNLWIKIGPKLEQTLSQIHEYARGGSGPRKTYSLPGVTHLEMFATRDPALQSLWINGRYAATVPLLSQPTIRALREVLKARGNTPTTITVQGSVHNRAFFVEGISLGDAPVA